MALLLTHQEHKAISTQRVQTELGIATVLSLKKEIIEKREIRKACPKTS